MATTSDPPVSKPAEPIVNYDEPPRKSPPLLVVGPLAWARTNLFSSWLNTIITIVSVVVIVTVLISFLNWTIGQAEWFAVIYNLRLLMLGRFPTDAEWRVALLAAIAAFAIGMALASWASISRRAALIIIGLMAILLVAPPIISAVTTPSPSFVAAGNSELVYSAGKETPLPQLAFIGKAGETISVRMAEQHVASDLSLSQITGFSDRAAQLLANAAADRLDIASRIDSFNAQLSSDMLTDGQRARLKTQLAKLKVPDPITETFALNTEPINVRILRGTTLEPLATGTLANGSAPISVTLPADGWYVLEKITVAKGAKGTALLEVTGIGPILQRDFMQAGDANTGGNANSDTRVFQSIRLNDNFLTVEARPSPDGKNIPMALVIDFVYRGNHSISDFFRLFVGPMFEVVRFPLLMLLVAGALGYWAARLIDRRMPVPNRPHRTSRQIATWLLVAIPLLMFALVYGVGNVLPLTDTRLWGGLLLTLMLTLVAVIVSFPIGVGLALGRRSNLPVIKFFSTLYIEAVRGVPLITILFMAQLLLPLVNPAVSGLPNVFRAMVALILFNAAYLAENVRGGLAAVPSGQEEAAKALGLNSLQITLNITLPQALRAIFPALVGSTIALMIDTSLVAIVGLLDLTGIAQNVVTQTEFLGLRRETLIFITLVYFSLSYIIVRVSRRVERSGSGANLSRQL